MPRRQRIQTPSPSPERSSEFDRQRFLQSVRALLDAMSRARLEVRQFREGPNVFTNYKFVNADEAFPLLDRIEFETESKKLRRFKRSDLESMSEKDREMYGKYRELSNMMYDWIGIRHDYFVGSAIRKEIPEMNALVQELSWMGGPSRYY